MSTYAELKAQHCQDLFARLPEMITHIGWSPERLRAERERRLQELVDAAVKRSPWHRARLAGLDPGTVTEDTLAGLPTMTKDDLLEHFDEIVTDPRLRPGPGRGAPARPARRRLPARSVPRLRQRRLQRSARRVRLRLGRVGELRGGDPALAGELAAFAGLDRLVMASVSAGHATHMTSAMMSTFSIPRLGLHRFPVTLPLAEIVEGINALQPDVLHGYPTAMRLLALEARAGRLRISPRRIAVGSEPLLPETRQLLSATWGVTVENVYATSEAGGVAGTCSEGLGLHLNDDQVRVLAPPCGCGSAMTAIEDVHGRGNDSFRRFLPLTP